MNRAFTVIETIIVIVIVAILAATAIPAFVSSHNTLKIESAYKQLMQDIRYTRQLAIASQVTHGISFNPSLDSYFLYRQDTSNVIKDPATQKPFSVTYASGPFSGVNLVSTTFTVPETDTLEFNSLGAPSGGGTVTLNFNGITKTITVEANTGRIY